MVRFFRCDYLGSYRKGLQRLMLRGVDHKPPMPYKRKNGVDHGSPIDAKVERDKSIMSHRIQPGDS
eukprot:2947374-Amphidinium_carterae.1